MKFKTLIIRLKSIGYETSLTQEEIEKDYLTDEQIIEMCRIELYIYKKAKRYIHAYYLDYFPKYDANGQVKGRHQFVFLPSQIIFAHKEDGVVEKFSETRLYKDPYMARYRQICKSLFMIKDYIRLNK